MVFASEPGISDGICKSYWFLAGDEAWGVGLPCIQAVVWMSTVVFEGGMALDFSPGAEGSRLAGFPAGGVVAAGSVANDGSKSYGCELRSQSARSVSSRAWYRHPPRSSMPHSARSRRRDMAADL